MTDFLLDAGLFAAKAFTVLVLFVLSLIAVLALVGRRRGAPEPHFILKSLNDELRHHREMFEDALLDDAALSVRIKARKSEAKKKKKEASRAAKAEAVRESAETTEAAREESGTESKKRLFVLDFDGDIQATELQQLKNELNVLLTLVTPHDEIVLRLESGGGAVHAYGLAACQLQRVRARGVRLTVCVDKVAASGGYMMACVADHLIAAPFAVLGSIGVVAQIPNLHRFLNKHDIDVELLTAGKHKRSLTVFGRNTEEGREKFRQELEVTHELFQDFVKQNRPALDVATIATGETWYGTRALELRLVDELRTSDDYLCAACENAEVVLVKYEEPEPLPQRLLKNMGGLLSRALRFL